MLTKYYFMGQLFPLEHWKNYFYGNVESTNDSETFIQLNLVIKCMSVETPSKGNPAWTICLKRKVLVQCVQPVLTYGAETVNNCYNGNVNTKIT